MTPALSVEHEGAVSVLTARDKIAAGESALELQGAVESLLREGRRCILVDLEQVTYIDSSGLGQLATAFKAVRDAGGDLKLLHVNPRVRALLHVTRLNRVFETFGAKEDALRSFASARTSGCYNEGGPPCWEVV